MPLTPTQIAQATTLAAAINQHTNDLLVARDDIGYLLRKHALCDNASASALLAAANQEASIAARAIVRALE